MFGMSEEQIIAWFQQFAYRPDIVFPVIFLAMLAGSFGLPIPEEVVIIAAGLVCHVGSRPDLYPPPFEGAQPLNTYFTAFFCFASIMIADYIVFWLGRRYGGQFLQSRFMAKYEDRMNKVIAWTQKYGTLAAGIFRFTPGLRFPGFFACGMLKMRPIVFLSVDGFAALISVPTQVILAAFYGDAILTKLKEFKIVVFGILLVVAAIYFYKRYRERHQFDPA